MDRRTWLAALLAVAAGALPALADPPPPAAAPGAPVAEAAPPPPAGEWTRPPEARLLLTSLTAARYNALGLYELLRIGGQWQLYRSESALLRENFVNLGLLANLSPSYARVGPMVELQPVSFFSLKMGGEFLGYWQTFNYLQSFQTPTAVWSDTALRTGREAHQDYTTWGLHAVLEPMLMVKFPIGAAGHLAFRNRLALEYWHLALRTPAGGRADTVFYEGNLDMLLGNDGWVLSDDFDALVMLPFRLNLGLRYSAIVPLYREDHFLTPAEAQAYAGDNVNQRLGLIATYTFFDRGFTSFNKPTVIFMANWYLQSRFRTGADVSRAVPYLALAFSFQSDLLE